MSINSQDSPTENEQDELLGSEIIINGGKDNSLEWQVKYERLFEAHRKLQKNNNSLEDKLLRIVEKFEAEKNQMRRDLASQTQRLVESKLTIQRLHDQNRHLQSDLNLSINLLRNRPNSFVAQKLESLPADVRASVRVLSAEKQKERSEGKKIRVAIPDDVTGSSFSLNGDLDELVSAAILAKVLEERDKERRRDRKFCIDVGTQTHGWHFGKSSTSAAATASNRATSSLLQNQQFPSSSSTGSGASPSKSSSGASSSTSGPSSPSDNHVQDDQTHDLDGSGGAAVLLKRPTSVRLSNDSNNHGNNFGQVNGGGAILFTSVIHTGGRQILADDQISRMSHSFGMDHSFPRGLASPRLHLEQVPNNILVPPVPNSSGLQQVSNSGNLLQQVPNNSLVQQVTNSTMRNLPPNTLPLPQTTMIPRSVTCSTLQTDL